MSRYPHHFLASLALAAGLITAPQSAVGQVPSIADLTAPSCDGAIPGLRIDVGETTWQLDRRYTTSQISQIAGNQGMSLVAGRGTIGLTVAIVNGQGDFESDVRKTSGGRWCATLTSLTLRIGFDGPLTVYAGAEFPDGSCAFNEILRHELGHVQRYKAALADARPLAEDVVLKQMRQQGASATGRTAEAANAALQRIVSKANSAMVSAITDFSLRRNLTIDTPEEYARVYAKCPTSEWMATR